MDLLQTACKIRLMLMPVMMAIKVKAIKFKSLKRTPGTYDLKNELFYPIP